MVKLMVVCSVLVAAACGGSGSDDTKVSELETQLEAAIGRAESAEAERDRLRAELDEASAATTTVPTPGSSAPDVSTTVVPVATSPSTTTTAPTTVPPTTAAPTGEPLPLDASALVTAFGDISAVDLPAGDPGVVAVIAHTGVLRRSGSLPVLVRNNTSKPVGQIEATGRARLDGQLVGTGSSQGFQPALLQPGEVAFGYVYFSYDGLPDGVEFELSASGREPSDMFGKLPAIVTEIAHTGNAIVGIVTNDGDEVIEGPISVDVACFSSDGAYTGTADAFTEEGAIAPGGTGSFSIDLYDGACDNGIAAAAGFSF